MRMLVFNVADQDQGRTLHRTQGAILVGPLQMMCIEANQGLPK